MADKQVTDLTPLSANDLTTSDLFLVVDVSASEDKKIDAASLASRILALSGGGTIPVSSVAITAQSINGSALINGSVLAEKLASGSVTAVKLDGDSVCVVGNVLPASGDFRGQLAFTAGDFLYVWSGSNWVEVKAPGSINEVLGNNTGNIVNISVTSTGSGVALDTSFDNTTAASQFLAGPTSGAGSIGYRTIVSDDLPTATTTAKGALTVDGEGLRIDGTRIEIDNDLSAQGTPRLVTHDAKGLVTGGRAIVSGDLPAATSNALGAVFPGSGLSVAVTGQLSHSNAIAGGTFTKVTVDTEGHVTTGTSLAAADVPEIPAERLTSGTLSIDRIGNNAITGPKLANYATVKFGGAGSTSGVVTFPTPEFAGQYFYDANNGDLYLYDGNTWQPITVISGDLVYGGTYNAATNKVKSVTTQGSAAGLTVGAALPAASATNLRYYVVVSDSGNGVSPAPAVALAPPDMIISNGATWDLVDVSNAIAGQTASNISFTPYGNVAANNCQTAIQELDDEKLARAGGTMTGELLIGTTGSLKFEGSSDDANETEITVANPTADRTVTIPDQSGNVLISGNASIVNADISASAAIADSKLATISTAGKVSNSATTATNANTPSAIVARDASGNFSAGTISAALSGNASTATALQTARTIQGVSFDGTANITVATAGTGISVTGTAIGNTGVLSVNGGTGAITNVAVTNTAQSFTAQQRGAISAIGNTSGTITLDFATANNFSLTLNANSTNTLATPSNITAGASGVIYITQDATGSRTLAYSSAWDFAGGTVPTLSTAANAVDCLAFAVRTTGSIAATLIKDVK